MLIAAVPAAANAACTIPDGGAGDQIYNSTYNVMQFCNGTNWVNMGAASSGGVTDGDKGDITVSGTGTAWAIDAGAVTVSALSATGTASSSTYLRGDGAWSTVSTGITGLTVGTTSITSGTTTRVLYDNAGALGEYTISGTGSVAMNTSPTITTPTFSTSATAPLIIGGTGTTSTLTLQSTSGVGTTSADIIFKVGNNGSTEAMRVLNSGYVGIGTSVPSTALQVNGTITATNAIITSGAPQVTVYASGSGTYSTPSNALYIVVEMTGGGGGGGGSDNGTYDGGTGGAGSDSTFGALTAYGGGGGGGGAQGATVGGSASGCDFGVAGGYGGFGGGAGTGAVPYASGGGGGNSYFGGGGYGGWPNANGGAGSSGSGGGGAGGTAGSGAGGAGGGAGGYCKKLIPSPTSTYSYAVGGGGSSGSPGSYGASGGSGGAGLITVTAFFR